MTTPFATRAFALLPLLVLAACISVGKERPGRELYVLQAAPAVVSKNRLEASVRVMEPEAAPGLDTRRIAVRDTPNHLTYYTGVAWAQPVPQLLQEFMIDMLSQSQAFKNVSSDQDTTFADIIVRMAVHDFEVDITGDAPIVRMRLSVTMVSGNSREVLRSFSVSRTAKAAANHMPQIMEAFDAAAAEAAAEIARKLQSGWRG